MFSVHGKSGPNICVRNTIYIISIVSHGCQGCHKQLLPAAGTRILVKDPTQTNTSPMLDSSRWGRPLRSQMKQEVRIHVADRSEETYIYIYMYIYV